MSRTRVRMLALVIGAGAALTWPSDAFASAPSHAHVRFTVPSTITPLDVLAGTTTAAVTIYWTSGSSPTGAACCTSKVFDGGTLLGRTTGTTFPAVISVGGYEVGPYEIKSYDANGSFVGSVTADPNFVSQFEDAYANDFGSDCGSDAGFSGSWLARTNSSNAGGSSCTSTTSGDSFVFGSDIADEWVTTTGPGRGSANVYIDGVYSQTVSTYSSVTRYRRVVWQHRFGSSGGHTITIVNLATPGHPRIDVDAQVFLTLD